MKAFSTVRAATLVLLCSTGASAQETLPSPAVRADVFGSLGWLNAHQEEIDESNDWYNRSLYGGGVFGWYWTDHHKTEIEAASSTAARLHSTESLVLNGRQTYLLSEYTFSTRRFTLSEQYQFGENAWFHPHLAGGLDLTWQRTRRRNDPAYVYDPVTRQTRFVVIPVAEPDRTELTLRPFVGAGFKAYMTRRAFFRTDMRLVLDGGVNQVLFRFGFGADLDR